MELDFGFKPELDARMQTHFVESSDQPVVLRFGDEHACNVVVVRTVGLIDE